MILRTKIITIIVIVLLVTIGMTTTVTLNLQSKRLTKGKLADIEVICNIILSSIDNAMAKGRTEDVQKSLENIGKNPEIINLRILSSDGYILKSKNPDEIGLKSKELVHYQNSEEGFKPIIRQNTISHFMPVWNRKKCYGCHDASAKINGLIDVKYDISRNRADVMAMKRFLVFSNILTVLLVSSILSALFARHLMGPLKDFLRAIKAVEDGDWDARIDVKRNDELGSIGTAFNRMVEEIRNLYEKSLKKEKEISKVKVELDHKVMLEELNAQLQYKIREVETANKAVLSLSKEVKAKNVELEKMVERLKRINEVGRVLTSIINIDELIGLIIKTTSETLRVEKGSIFLQKNPGSTLYVQYQRDIGIERSANVSVDLNPLYSGLIEEGKPLMLNNGSANSTADSGISSAIGVPLKMKGQIIGGMLLEVKADGTQFTSDELELLGTMANQAMVSIENAWLYETVKSNYFGTIQALVNALEASDRYTKGHSERVRFMGLELGKYIGLDYRELELFEHAAILHDIGKIGIDSSVLNKEGGLTNAEFSLIRAHPIIGDEILGPIGTLQGVRTTILQHHEKYDGTGYPYGIAGDEITLKARILAIVDTLDAMLSDRPYRKALSLQRAMSELKEGAGTQFDPQLVGSFLELLDENVNMLKEAGYSLN
jgi:HD-GYP domain-containing protein (c-di-GMP phosphodiesterase class II)